VVSDACAGLEFAHNLRGEGGRPLNLVHRDVSPENILVTYGGVTKVVDFGIAKAASVDTHTKTGQVKGKVGYMSPEQLLSEPVDRRADVWALGVVLYWVCTGVKPFSADSEAATMQKILYSDPPPMRERAPHVPDAIVEVVRKALTREAGLRYQTAGAMREDLEAWLREVGAAGTSTALSVFMSEQFPEQTDENRRVVNALLECEVPKNTSNTDRTLPTAAGLQPPTSVQRASPPLRPPTLQRPSTTDELAAPFRRKRRIALGVSLGSAALVLLTGTGWALLHDGRELAVPVTAETATVVPPSATSAQPAKAQSVPSPAPSLTKAAAPSPQPTAAAQPPAASPVTPRVSLPVHHRVTHRTAEAETPTPAPAPVVGSGFLDVRAVPWASVYLDGQLVGTTPMDPVEVSAGQHQVRLVNDDVHASQVRTVHVVAGQTALVKAKLAAE
jgi:serine/threonine-protein kinase